MSTLKRKGKVLDAPMAITSDGTVLLNVTHLKNGDALEAARELLAEGHEVFVGIAVPGQLRGELLRGIEDGAADLLGRIGPKLRQRTRR